MTPEMQKYIDLLESQLGYSEKSGDYTKFGDWYGKNIEFDADYTAAPWCDMYLSWAAHKLGYEEWIGQFAWTVAHAKWFKEQDAWGKTPKVGAFVFYDWSGTNSIDRIDHVGIVTRIEGDTIYTIEGNIDGGVAKRKERDTSKVVGYGYPQRVKERLDKEAAKKAAQEAPIEIGEESLSSMIPRPDGDPVPLIAHGGESTKKQDQDRIELRNESPAKSDAKKQTRAEEPARQPELTAKAAPQATAAPTGAPKKGKHAKPATADTTAETAKPLPTHVDASAGSPLPSVDSPTLIGSALVAAIALLAVAKTRRLRLAPAPAAATSSRPSRSKAGRRRRRRATTAPITATAARRDPLEVLDAPKRSVETVETPRHRRLETRPFNLATDAAPAQAAGRPHRHAAGTPLDTEPFRPAFDAEPFEPDFDRSDFTFTEDTGTIAAIQDTGPLEVVLDTGPLRRVVDTGPFERIVIPGASSPWDAFAPSRRRGGDVRDISATYRGRRRSAVVEEGAVFQNDAPPRGRRHRQAFTQDVPLRGRRHRGAPEDDGRLVGAGGGRGRHRA